ncbi:MAG: dTDP-4-dehydrorhamnose reductase [Gemmatimonadota bacterium]
MASAARSDGGRPILVTGAGGLLGSEVVTSFRRAGRDVVAVERATLDITDAPSVSALFEDVRPGVVVNCAAYTQVDRAESEPEAAYAVNRDGAGSVARAAARCGARLIHISTDFVFDGRARRPYRPEDPTRPLGVYGASKHAGEEEVRRAGGAWAIVRTSWLYGRGGRNFVDRILERARTGEPLRVVADQRGRPTAAPGLADTLRALDDLGATGIWHVADGGEATWFELAREACRLAGLTPELTPVATGDWPAPAPRPPYSVLDLERTERALGRPFADWRSALEGYLASGADLVSGGRG